MLSRKFVGWMRRIGVWSVGQRVHRTIAPFICAGIHRAVKVIGHRYLPIDLVLKHHYDYRVVHLDPKLITGVLLVNAGTRPTGVARTSRKERFRLWRELGGGWKSLNRHITRNLHGRFIADGDWDIEAKPFEVRQSIVQLFQEGRKPEDTTEYQKFSDRVSAGNLVWTRGLRSGDDIDSYFEKLIQIYEDIKSGGFKTQRELGMDGSDEIRICIDRDGRINVFGGGTHRLSIALVLGVVNVPVLIKRIHSDWATKCCQRYGGTLVAAIAQGVDELAVERQPPTIRDENGTGPEIS